MKMLVSHGDKGGTGKSMVSTVLVEYALAHHPDGLLIIEGDTRVPDVARRYQGHVPGIAVPLNRPGRQAEEAVAQLFERIEAKNPKTVIINLPGSAGETLDPLARELLAPTVEALGIDLTVLYALGPDVSSAEGALQSARDGLVSVAGRRIAVLNEHLGDAANFAIRQHRSDAEELYHAILMLPPLAESVARVVRETPGPLAQLIEGPDSPLSTIHRMLLRSWRDRAFAIARAAFGDGGEVVSIEKAREEARNG